MATIGKRKTKRKSPTPGIAKILYIKYIPKPKNIVPAISNLFVGRISPINKQT